MEGKNVKNRECVLLTTLSTVGKQPQYTYYYCKVDDKYLYCNGIISVEPGSKYFLSKKKVDRIIAISSQETRKDNDLGSLNNIDIIRKRGTDITEYSAANQFYSRLCYYTYGTKADDDIKLDPVRKKELLDIVYKALKKKDKTINKLQKEIWFDAIVRHGVQKEINEAVRADIEKNFATNEDYARYNDAEWQKADAEFREKVEERVSADDFISWLNDNKRGFLSSIKKEAFCKIYRDQLNEWFEEIGPVGAETAWNMRNIAEGYKQFSEKLTSELSVLRSNRLNEEIDNIKKYLYSLMPSENKLHTLDLNKGVNNRPTFTVVCNDSIYDIVQTIIGNSEKSGIDLLIDVQGGDRTNAFVLNSMLSILKSTENIDCTFCSVKYERNNFANEIVEETERYKISDLVGAMNAFINYGKAGAIKEFFKEESQKEKETNNLLNSMTNLEEGLALCNADKIVDSVRSIKKSLRVGINTDNDYLKTLIAGIKREYDAISVDEKGEPEMVSIIRWAMKKGFVQQALTLVEAKMPHEIVKSGIVYYAINDDELKTAKAIFSQLYNNSDSKNRYRFNDIDHYFIKTNAIIITKTLSSDDKKLLSITKSGCSKSFVNTILTKYKKISDIRNGVNHAGDGAVNTVKNLENMLNEFLDSFQRIKNEKTLKMDICFITKNDILPNTSNQKPGTNKKR